MSESNCNCAQNQCNVACILVGGPTLWMDVRGKTIPFELHPYCGPTPVSKKDHAQPLTSIPAGFWDSWERFDAGGRVLNGNVCVLPRWCETCKGTGDEVLEIVPKFFEYVGKCKACEGKKVVHENNHCGQS